jgi:hypothetical protein
MIILHPPGPIFHPTTHQAFTNWKFLISGNPPPKRRDENKKSNVRIYLTPFEEH